jgi:membrane protease YdiL (CAAX protease family)
MAVRVSADPVRAGSADPIKAGAPVRQFSRAGVAAVWAAAAVPMGLLAWVVAPAVAGAGASPRRFVVTLIAALTAGLIWQFVLVMLIVAREQHSLRWAALRRALWLEPPTGTDGRRGGRLWLWLLPGVLGFAALSLVPAGPLAGPVDRDFGSFLGSAAGKATFHGNWGLFALVLVMLVFNTVLGEELLFRGLLLPRMRGVFGRADWIANAVLFGLYHLSQPWSIPSSVGLGMLAAYPTRRFHSAWMGIAIHSAQSVFFAALLLTIVLH